MPEPFLDDLRMLTSHQQQRRRRVPQIVKPKMRKSGLGEKGLSPVPLEIALAERAAVGMRVDEALVAGVRRRRDLRQLDTFEPTHDSSGNRPAG